MVGGDKIIHEDEPGSPAASKLKTKILIKSVISDAKQGGKVMSCDLRDFFIATLMEIPEYMKIHLKFIPKILLTNMFFIPRQCPIAMCT